MRVCSYFHTRILPRMKVSMLVSKKLPQHSILDRSKHEICLLLRDLLINRNGFAHDSFKSILRLSSSNIRCSRLGSGLTCREVMESKSTAPFPHAGKPIRCKAAICRSPCEPLVIEEIEVDPPKAWEVRIKIICTSLCHSDVTFWKMKEGPLAIFPRILGHEAVGVVESVGENVEEVKEGDKVVPVFHPNCGYCRDCKSNKSNCCTAFQSEPKQQFAMPRDGSSRFKDMNGETLHHFIQVSSFAEYTVVDVANLVKISDELPVNIACLLSCGVSTGIGGAWKVADVEEGSTVAIFGLGTIGLAVAEGARHRGASKIIGIDLNAEKFELAKSFGVTDFVNPATCEDKPVSEVIKEMTDGGADYCFECIGLASLMADAFNSSRDGWGKTVILGVEMHGTPLTVSPYDILKNKTIMGALYGGLKPKRDIPILANKYLNKELHVDNFITHEVGFHDINKAFEYLLQGKSLRCIIWMDK